MLCPISSPLRPAAAKAVRGSLPFFSGSGLSTSSSFFSFSTFHRAASGSCSSPAAEGMGKLGINSNSQHFSRLVQPSSSFLLSGSRCFSKQEASACLLSLTSSSGFAKGSVGSSRPFSAAAATGRASSAVATTTTAMGRSSSGHGTPAVQPTSGQRTSRSELSLMDQALGAMGVGFIRPTKMISFGVNFILNFRFYFMYMARTTFQAVRPLLAFSVFGEVMKLVLATMSSGLFSFLFSFVLAFEVLYFFLQCYISYTFLTMFFTVLF